MLIPDCSISVYGGYFASMEQHKGYAQGAMKRLPDFAREHFTFVQKLVLIVNHANVPAQNLYKKAGFSDTGRRRNGNHGLQYIYHYSL